MGFMGGGSRVDVPVIPPTVSPAETSLSIEDALRRRRERMALLRSRENALVVDPGQQAAQTGLFIGGTRNTGVNA